jgi:hypothetical protein
LYLGEWGVCIAYQLGLSGKCQLPGCWPAVQKAGRQSRYAVPGCHSFLACAYLQGSACLGADTLVALLKNYCRNAGLKTSITVSRHQDNCCMYAGTAALHYCMQVEAHILSRCCACCFALHGTGGRNWSAQCRQVVTHQLTQARTCGSGRQPAPMTGQRHSRQGCKQHRRPCPLHGAALGRGTASMR